MPLEQDPIETFKLSGGRNHIVHDTDSNGYIEPICNSGLWSEMEGELDEYESFDEIPQLCQQCDKLGIIY